MTAELATSAEPSPKTPTKKPQPPTCGAGEAVLVGTWIGSLAGFGDLAILVAKRRWLDPDFYHFGDQFVWIIPMSVLIMGLALTLVFALFASFRGSIRLWVVVAALSFAGLFEIFARLPLELWACCLISAGLAVQFARMATRRPTGFLELTRRTVALSVGALVAVMAVSLGGRRLAESRQRASLPPAPPAAPNVLLIVWDTVRAANTSLHGYARPTTPNLEMLASRGVSFDRAFATSPWTLPSHAGMFTGRWPHEIRADWKRPMREDLPTLAEYLAAHGYETAGFVANLDYCGRETGLARGFAHYDDYPLTVFDAFIRYTSIGRRIDRVSWRYEIDSFLNRWHLGGHELIPGTREHVKNGEAVDREFLSWLGKRPATARPFFAFLNLNDAHSPYEIPDPAAPAFGRRPQTPYERAILQQFTGVDKKQLSSEDVQMIIDIYDDCVAYLDRRLGLLLDELRQRGVLDNTLLIITSDHGEHLGDHQLFFHGNSLYRQSLQVPLVIAGPAAGVPLGRKVAEAVGLNDLPATVIDLLGKNGRSPFPGRSLSRYWEPREPGVSLRADPLLMETTKPVFFANDGREPAAKGPMKSVIVAGMHYIQTADRAEELFNVNTDPEEKANLSGNADAIPVLVQMRNLLDLMLSRR
jgi:arylsulfatase A-like enzyme